MTDTISKAAKAKARKLLDDFRFMNSEEALAHVLQEHSDIAKEAYWRLKMVESTFGPKTMGAVNTLQSMILPDDELPLAKIIGDAGLGFTYGEDRARRLRQALDAAGYEIRRKDG